MSGHCPKCGAYHEEDDDRLCSACEVTKCPCVMSITRYRVEGGDWTFREDPIVGDWVRASEHDATIADLSAKLARAMEVVRKCEWDEDHCQLCTGQYPYHARDCKLAAVLKENA